MAVVAGRAVAVVVGELGEVRRWLRAVLRAAARTRCPVMPIWTCSTSSKWQWYMYVPSRCGPVEVGELLADRHGHRHLRHAVVERRRDVEAVPVDGVRVGQVGALDQAEVRQRDLDVVVLLEVEDRRRVLRVALVGRDQLADGRGRVDRDEPEDVERVVLPAGHRDVAVGGDQGQGRGGRPGRGHEEPATQDADQPAGRDASPRRRARPP